MVLLKLVRLSLRLSFMILVFKLWYVLTKSIRIYPLIKKVHLIFDKVNSGNTLVLNKNKSI